MTALVGRDRERGALDAVLGRASIGEGAALVVEAEAGIGKSTLLADLHSRARLAHVAHAEADEMEQGRPFGVILRALGCTSRATDERRRRVASLLHAMPRSDTDELLGRLAGDRFAGRAGGGQPRLA